MSELRQGEAGGMLEAGRVGNAKKVEIALSTFLFCPALAGCRGLACDSNLGRNFGV